MSTEDTEISNSYICEICGKLILNDFSSIVFVQGYGNGEKCVLCTECRKKIKNYMKKLKEERL